MPNATPQLRIGCLIISACMLALVAASCGSGTSPTMPSSLATSSTTPGALSAATLDATGGQMHVEKQPPANCTFSNGTTTCITTVTTTETGTHQAFSGCLYGPYAAPGRRIRTFEDTYTVTETTTTLQHGKSGAVYDTQSDTTRQLVSSRQISDVCEPL
jgi:hypothetical protein